MYCGKKVAFVFPGQGAQYVSMASDFIEASKKNREVLESFDKAHSTQLLSIMAQGPVESLKETKFTQPAILFHSVCAKSALCDVVDNLDADFVAGHSLGEFSALVASGVLTLTDAMFLVHKRGQFMMSANTEASFAMSAIVGLSPSMVKDICHRASDVGVVVAANYNTPVQTVISGSKTGVKRAAELAKDAGAKMVIPLVMGGPFHSPLIAKAGEDLAEEMEKMSFSDGNIPIVSNVDALPTTDSAKVKSNLQKQVYSSVLWVDSVEYMIEQGVEVFIEFGPGRVVSGMIKKIFRKAKIFNVDKLTDIERVKTQLEKMSLEQK